LEDAGVASAVGMPAPSTAELSRPIAFPAVIGEPLWRERRRFPVAAVYGVPAAFLAVLAVAFRPPAAHVAIAVATVVTVALLLRARRGALIETYSLSEVRHDRAARGGKGRDPDRDVDARGARGRLGDPWRAPSVWSSWRSSHTSAL
jgi:hypothetical protein